MANELSLSLGLNYTKNNAGVSKSVSPQITVSGTPFAAHLQNIGTTDETLDLGDVGTIGFVFLHNLDASNYITFGSDGSAYPLKLKAGESMIVRWNAAAIHAKANTAACDLEYAILSD
jgi:hypothetical protein